MIIKQTSVLHLFIPAIAMVGAFTLFIPGAEAKITVEGNREFTDDVNGCLNTYRNTPGVVGDVIKELEKSSKVHKITESPDWENVANDDAKSKNGTGTGTTTKVSKTELEEIKKTIPELANKDFCTAFLHELWHAVDADRGGWSDAKKNNVWEDEIEATRFQNFIHALRGVPPRTSYGADISEFLMLTDFEAGKTTTPMDVLVLPNGFFPKSQFRIAGADACDSPHYHAGKVFGLKTKTGTEIVNMTDPAPRGCGFGKVPEVTIEKLEITVEQLDALKKSGAE